MIKILPVSIGILMASTDIPSLYTGLHLPVFQELTIGEPVLMAQAKNRHLKCLELFSDFLSSSVLT
jgi:hypothetical protein